MLIRNVTVVVNLVYGFTELAERLGVSKQRTSEIINRFDFPEPIDYLAAGRVWAKTEVEVWIKKHRPNLDHPDEE
nr:helix-turn-helix domain-containing protein [Micromonospora sp. DSM 115978]